METDVGILNISDAMKLVIDTWGCRVTRATVAAWCRKYKSTGFAKKSIPSHGGIWLINKQHLKELLNGQEEYETAYNIVGRKPGRPKKEKRTRKKRVAKKENISS